MEVKRYADDWAYDLPIQLISKGEIVNEDVINQSIEMILATLRGERLFRPSFGSDFSRRLFDIMGDEFYNKLLDDTVEAIKRWEDRIVVLEDLVHLFVDDDNNSVTLTIPYIIKQRRIKAEFKKKIKQ